MSEQEYGDYEPHESDSRGIGKNGAARGALPNPIDLDPRFEDPDLDMDLDEEAALDEEWSNEGALDELYVALDEYDEFSGMDPFGDENDLVPPAMWTGDKRADRRSRRRTLDLEEWEDEEDEMGLSTPRPPRRSRRSVQRASGRRPHDQATRRSAAGATPDQDRASETDGERRPLPSAKPQHAPNVGALASWLAKQTVAEPDPTTAAMLVTGLTPIAVSQHARPTVTAAILPTLLHMAVRWTHYLHRHAATRRLLGQMPHFIGQTAEHMERRAAAGRRPTPQQAAGYFSHLVKKAVLDQQPMQASRPTALDEWFLDETEW